MLSRSRSLLVAGLTAVLLTTSACQTSGIGMKEGVGGVGGAVLGGLLGSQVGSGNGQLIATGAGAVIGLLVGSSIGASLDEVDRMKAQQAAQTSLERAPDGVPVAWSNPNTGAQGVVTPVKTYQTGSQYCREYQTEITVGGRTEQGYGTACRNDASQDWQIVGS